MKIINVLILNKTEINQDLICYYLIFKLNTIADFNYETKGQEMVIK
jgi:hypothetical protein